MSFVSKCPCEAFVGAGVMAFALARGFTDSQRVQKEHISMVVRNDTKKALVEDLGYKPILDPRLVRSRQSLSCLSLLLAFLWSSGNACVCIK